MTKSCPSPRFHEDRGRVFSDTVLQFSDSGFGAIRIYNSVPPVGLSTQLVEYDKSIVLVAEEEEGLNNWGAQIAKFQFMEIVKYAIFLLTPKLPPIELPYSGIFNGQLLDSMRARGMPSGLVIPDSIWERFCDWTEWEPHAEDPEIAIQTGRLKTFGIPTLLTGAADTLLAIDDKAIEVWCPGLSTPNMEAKKADEVWCSGPATLNMETKEVTFVNIKWSVNVFSRVIGTAFSFHD